MRGTARRRLLTGRKRAHYSLDMLEQLNALEDKLNQLLERWQFRYQTIKRQRFLSGNSFDISE
jgi:hypothetical protein